MKLNAWHDPITSRPWISTATDTSRRTRWCPPPSGRGGGWARSRWTRLLRNTTRTRWSGCEKQCQVSAVAASELFAIIIVIYYQHGNAKQESKVVNLPFGPLRILRQIKFLQRKIKTCGRHATSVFQVDVKFYESFVFRTTSWATKSFAQWWTRDAAPRAPAPGGAPPSRRRGRSTKSTEDLRGHWTDPTRFIRAAELIYLLYTIIPILNTFICVYICILVRTYIYNISTKNIYIM